MIGIELRGISGGAPGSIDQDEGCEGLGIGEIQDPAEKMLVMTIIGEAIAGNEAGDFLSLTYCSRTSVGSLPAAGPFLSILVGGGGSAMTGESTGLESTSSEVDIEKNERPLAARPLARWGRRGLVLCHWMRREIELRSSRYIWAVEGRDEDPELVRVCLRVDGVSGGGV